MIRISADGSRIHVTGAVMKKLLLASFATFSLFSFSAFAADMPLKALAPPPAPPSWTGCYANAGFGYGMWNQDHYFETYPELAQEGPSITGGGRGWMGIFGGGCDYQFSAGNLGNWVIGVFGDFDPMSLSGTFNDDVELVSQGKETEQWAWAVGGRIGYLVTPIVLAYFNGGYTETRFDQINLSTSTFPPTPESDFYPAQTYRGWFIGGGTEYAFTWLPIPGLFWRNEYRYSSYESADVPETRPGLTSVSAEHMQKSVQTITSSLVWRFNWTGH